MPNPNNVGKSPLLYESDGDFNPGWLLFLAAFLLAVLAIAAVLLLMAFAGGSVAGAVVLGVVLTFALCVMLLAAISVLSLAKAKLVAPALTSAAGGLAGDENEGGGYRTFSRSEQVTMPMEGE